MTIKLDDLIDHLQWIRDREENAMREDSDVLFARYDGETLHAVVLDEVHTIKDHTIVLVARMPIGSLSPRAAKVEYEQLGIE